MGSRLAALCLRTRFSSPNQQAHSYILPKFLDPTVRLRPRRPIRSPRCEQDKGQRPVAPLPASHFHAGPTDPRPAVGPTSAPSPPRVPLAPTTPRPETATWAPPPPPPLAPAAARRGRWRCLAASASMGGYKAAASTSPTPTPTPTRILFNSLCVCVLFFSHFRAAD